MVGTNRDKCQKFEESLRNEIRYKIIAVDFETYTKLKTVAIRVETFDKKKT